jgi:hypothetical protein
MPMTTGCIGTILAWDTGMTPCNACFVLSGELAREEPHEALRMHTQIELSHGTREEYVCQTCGAHLQRFRAKQTSPTPTDRWRFAD